MKAAPYFQAHPDLPDVKTFYGIRYRCPCGGCGSFSILPVHWKPEGYIEYPGAVGKPHWNFNGDFEQPTFQPSVLTTTKRWEPPVNSSNLAEFKRAPWPQQQVDHVCHSFITAGKIQFLNDCTHELAGQTVELPELVGEG